MKKIFQLSTFVVVTSLSLLAARSVQAQPAPSAAMGQAIYEQKGSNSCIFCHGVGGENGSVAAAAKLDHPKTWRTFKTLGKGGENFEKAIENLIIKGAVSHNATFKESFYDWKKSGPFNGQMMGLTGAPSASWLSRMKDRGVTKEVAAKSLVAYIKTLDKDGFWK